MLIALNKKTMYAYQYTGDIMSLNDMGSWNIKTIGRCKMLFLKCTNIQLKDSNHCFELLPQSFPGFVVPLCLMYLKEDVNTDSQGYCIFICSLMQFSLLETVGIFLFYVTTKYYVNHTEPVWKPWQQSICFPIYPGRALQKLSLWFLNPGWSFQFPLQLLSKWAKPSVYCLWRERIVN